MINYKPVCTAATLAPPQTGLRAKFGGRPWGLSPRRWPAGLTLLCQLPHDPPAVDLGGDFVLHLWHFAGGEDYRDPPAYAPGAWATLLPRGELGDGPTPAPPGQRLIGELFVDRWEPYEDGVPAAWLPDYFDPRAHRALLDREVGGIETGLGSMTKAGGGPRWCGLSSIHRLPEGRALSFLFQTDGRFPMAPPRPTADALGGEVYDWPGPPNGAGLPTGRARRVEPAAPLPNAPWAAFHARDPAGGWTAVICDFAGDGAAFVFLDRSTDPPAALWDWSR